jgi:hypothetical protein
MGFGIVCETVSMAFTDLMALASISALHSQGTRFKYQSGDLVFSIHQGKL